MGLPTRGGDTPQCSGLLLVQGCVDQREPERERGTERETERNREGERETERERNREDRKSVV